ncbi:amino acid permease [Desulfococcaceae bacterium HSG9]|nr:amino acid permease [Desulfococcaceae bacterium HSG9]
MNRNSSQPLTDFFKLTPLVWVTALMFSPDTLILLGNLAGGAGDFLVGMIIIIGTFQILNAKSYNALARIYPQPAGEALFFKSIFGPLPAAVLSLISRLVFTVCAATGMLVASGFAFNEIFLYWFPNFAFAFILLGVILAINLLGEDIAQKAQIAFVVTAVSGIILLSFAGLAGTGTVSTPVEAHHPALNMRNWASVCLLFAGFDLVYLNRPSKDVKRFNPYNYMVIGIISAGVLLGLWGLMSLKFVASHKLADTTIPHLIVARKILGQPGRIIMGIVIITGTCGAVNALFRGVSQITVGLAKERLLPAFFARNAKRAPLPLVVLTVTTALMMALGMAGADELDVYIRAGLLFWLLCYAMLHLAFLLARRHEDFSASLEYFPHPLVNSVAIFLLAVVSVLIYTDSEALLLIKFMVLMSAVILFLVFIGMRLTKNISF